MKVKKRKSESRVWLSSESVASSENRLTLNLVTYKLAKRLVPSPPKKNWLRHWLLAIVYLCIIYFYALIDAVYIVHYYTSKRDIKFLYCRSEHSLHSRLRLHEMRLAEFPDGTYLFIYSIYGRESYNIIIIKLWAESTYIIITYLHIYCFIAVILFRLIFTGSRYGQKLFVHERKRGKRRRSRKITIFT